MMTPILLSLIFSSPCHAKLKPEAKPPRIHTLRVEESYTVDLAEVSGLTWRKNPETKKRELVMVGDREFKIIIVDWEARKSGLVTRVIDLKPAPKPGVLPMEQSEWESVTSDETGRLYILQESPAQVLVIAADLSRIESRIDLTVPKGVPDPTDWNAADNAGGEGLLPLNNGHFLIVKEKSPLRILEFAETGQKAEGYRVGLGMEKGGKFPTPKVERAEFAPIFHWEYRADLDGLIEDGSALALDARGDLYMLGDQRNLLVRLGKKLSTAESALKVDRLWSIPSTLQQSEGLVIDSQDRPIVAIDRKNTKQPNLFLLSPLR